MAATKNVVNLDALIPRADLATGVNSDNVKGLTLNSLERGTLVYKQLRKPDFQRETSNWRPEQVAQLIITFLTKELVPALVLWEAGPQVFVIDGAHRLSALIGWVHDDYGDGDVSRGFFHGEIPKSQKEAAERVRELVYPVVGSYAEHKADNPRNADFAERAKLIAWHEIQVQWIRNADAASAENSFFRINQGGTTIDPTESRILNARGSATALASRSILTNGIGNAYWGKFSTLNKEKIETLGKELNSLLFQPDYDLPISTLDLPMAGYGYGPSALPFVFDIVNLANDVQVPDSSRKKFDKEEAGFVLDEDGELTIRYLTKVREAVWRICSKHASSMGLHPALYFYNASGVFQPNSLLAIVELFSKWSTADFRKFTDARRTVEDFLLSNRGTTEAIRNLGSGSRSRPRLRALYRRLIDMAIEGKSAAEIFATLVEEPEYRFLAIEPAKPSGKPGARLSRSTKATSYLNTRLPSVVRCPTCGGMIYDRAMQHGHIQHRRDGGTDGVDNAMMQHPFCNSTYAN